MSLKYYIINKPFGVLSQFTPEHNNTCLKDVFEVPNDVYPVGRLDKDSEGLLILTNDTSLNQKVLHPKNKATKVYSVQVDGAITDEAVHHLEKGVTIKVKKKTFQTLPTTIIRITSPNFWERTPPIRYRKDIPTSWIEIHLSEGKNRQIRKMTAAVGFPTLRIVRTKIAGLDLHGLLPGEQLELEKSDIYKKLALL